MNHFYCRAELGPKGCKTEKPEITLTKTRAKISQERKREREQEEEKKSLRGENKKNLEINRGVRMQGKRKSWGGERNLHLE